MFQKYRKMFILQMESEVYPLNIVIDTFNLMKDHQQIIIRILNKDI